MANDTGIVNEAELDWFERPRGDFAGRGKRLGQAAGGERLGATLYEIPPGKKVVPYHYHTANEEAIYVLAGAGTVRLDDEEFEIEAGDYVALPVGEAGAHQVINSGEEPIRYLCVSTMREPDVMVYPDSGKVAILAGAAPGSPPGEATFSKILRSDAEVGYWDGEVEDGTAEIEDGTAEIDDETAADGDETAEDGGA